MVLPRQRADFRFVVFQPPEKFQQSKLQQGAFLGLSDFEMWFFDGTQAAIRKLKEPVLAIQALRGRSEKDFG